MTARGEWWRGGVIYQIYPRSFMDSNGDGIGDLPGITARLDYIAALGADAIWISPFFKSPMKDFGYDVADYCAVDPLFGTLDDFRTLLERAHRIGLKVMIDQVWSHTSDQHAWFGESRTDRTNAKADWYIWANPKPDGTAPNNWLSYFGGPAWTWDSRREQYYFHQFLKEQPTLNLWNPAVRKAIKAVAAFWLDLGVDGFRLDAIHTYLADRNLHDNPPCPPETATDIPRTNPMAYQDRTHTANLPENIPWIEEIRAFVNRWPERCLLAEVGGNDPERAAGDYTKTGKRCHLAYSFGLVGSAMAYDDILKTIQSVEDSIGDGWHCWATSNHDFKRAPSRLAGAAPLADKALFATKLGLSLRGSYCLYQGEELGLPQADLAFAALADPYDKALYPFHVGRDGCRTPMPWASRKPHAGFSNGPAKPWLPIPPEHTLLAADTQDRPESVLRRTHDFICWRKAHPALYQGHFEWVTAQAPVLAFRRTTETTTILCLFNCSDTPQKIPETLARMAKLVPEISHSAKQDETGLSLRPYGAAFLM